MAQTPSVSNRIPGHIPTPRSAISWSVAALGILIMGCSQQPPPSVDVQAPLVAAVAATAEAAQAPTAETPPPSAPPDTSPVASPTPSPTSVPVATFTATPTPTPQLLTMGGGALGGSAVTTLLSREVLTLEETAGTLAWVAHEIRLGSGEAVEHTHEFAFVYAATGPHVLTKGSESQRLESTQGAVVRSGSAHRHEAPDRPSVFWEIRLVAPGSPPPLTEPSARLIFESSDLEGIPSRALGAFVHVLVPAGGETSIHTHPGPELIYQIVGRIEYENALIGAREMGPGEIEGIPPGVAVQKRNSFADDAEFLSWFLVDITEPFASPARFSTPEIKGGNIAAMEKGAKVVGVSSNYGNGANDSAFGANNALDGDLNTEWSSDGEGDNAWIEIELPLETHVTSIGFWTRTMTTSAQIFSFRVITDRGEVYGPFELAGAGSIYYFDTDLTAKRLRFESVSTSGGNTGAVEIEVFGEPAQ